MISLGMTTRVEVTPCTARSCSRFVRISLRLIRYRHYHNFGFGDVVSGLGFDPQIDVRFVFTLGCVCESQLQTFILW